ncbi:Sec-independent protein translocase subunit TatA [Skermania sp. ID1734]|uniref:Sec-independent protein translocase subunit TatA n=1 Tax=Skermania sp. ID1734 TaxID=2597516 RepID=UPI00117BFB3A|nr:Sec-independent protein translocase subunit TatA [Skermania sp. ID1734]TSE01647.1 Sec-independent protein translocase subunit TatA [Skermania sp. ID1734]
MGAMSWWHWAIVLVVLVVLFGSKRLPDAARGLGQSLRIFKSEIKEMQNDGKSQKPAEPAAQAQLPESSPQPAPTVNTEQQKSA